MLFQGCFSVLVASVCIKIVHGAPQLGGDLAYSPMQVIQATSSAAQSVPRAVPPVGGLASQTNQASIQVIQRTTSAAAPALTYAQSIPAAARAGSGSATSMSSLNTQAAQGSTSGIASVFNLAQNIPHMMTQAVPLVGMIPGSPFSAANQNFQRVLVRGGMNVLGEGAKAGATIPTIPTRVVAAGVDEFRKVAVARLGTTNSTQPLDIKTKIVSTVLNTVSSQLAQANLGGEMVEEALKNRVRDMANKIAEIVVPITSQTAQAASSASRGSGAQEVLPVTTKVVDTLLDQFNSAVRRNDERLMQALKAVIAKVDPPKSSA